MPVNQVMPGKVQANLALFPRYIDDKALAAGVAESFNVPDGVTSCIISATGGVWACITGTAAVGTDESDGTGSLYIGSTAMFAIPGAATLSVIAKADCEISIGWYRS